MPLLSGCFFMLMSLFSVNTFAQQPAQEHGVIRMNGSIIDTPCTIDIADRDQTLELGTNTVINLIRKKESETYPFTIHLMNCRLQSVGRDKADWPQFQMTFDGQPDDGLFRINGASGVGLEIADRAGHIATPGKPMPYEAMSSGRMELNYVLRLVGDHSRLQAGDYRAAIRFKIDYF